MRGGGLERKEGERGQRQRREWEKLREKEENTSMRRRKGAHNMENEEGKNKGAPQLTPFPSWHVLPSGQFIHCLYHSSPPKRVEAL